MGGEFKEACGPWGRCYFTDCIGETGWRTFMLARLAIIGGILFIGATSTYAQQAGIERKMLLQKEGPPGYQTIVNVLEFAPGAREVRHTHPGALSGYVLEGTLTLEHEGRPRGRLSMLTPARFTSA
jgi:hypothetical protein